MSFSPAWTASPSLTPADKGEAAMLHVYEFEIFEDEGMFVALPYDMDGGTQGSDFREGCENAADWLRLEMEHRTMHDEPYPEGTFDNQPNHGGRNVVVAVRAATELIPS